MRIASTVLAANSKRSFTVHVDHSSTPPAPSPASASARSAPPPLPVRLRRAALTAVLFGVFAAVLYAKGVPCAFARIFHTPCPGCGSTRAVLALLHGDLPNVLRYNPLGPVVAVLLGVLGIQSFVSVLSHGDFRDAGEGRIGLVVKRILILVVIVEVLLWVARFFGALGGPVPV